ncbi:MAG: histidine phosphatase family protein [Chloroflexota bacterium]
MGSLVLVRHATTAASASGRNLGQASDMPLSDAGAQLAERLAVALAAELAELPHDNLRLVTSPAQRCRSTIAPVARTLAVEAERIEVEPGLLEIDYGAWDGLSAEECHARDPQLRAAWEADPYATRCPDGESGADVAARALPLVHALAAWAAEDRARCGVVVAHNHVNRLVLTDLLGWPMRDYRRRLNQEPAGYNIVTFGGDGPVIRRINAAAAANVPAE